MCIWLDLQVFKIGDFGLCLGLGKPRRQRQAKPAVWEAHHGVPSYMAERGYWISLLLERGQDGLIRSSAVDFIAAQVYLNKQSCPTKIT